MSSILTILSSVFGTTGWILKNVVKYGGYGLISAVRWIATNVIKYGWRASSWLSTSGISSAWRTLCSFADYTWHFIRLIIRILAQFLSAVVPSAVKWWFKYSALSCLTIVKAYLSSRHMRICTQDYNNCDIFSRKFSSGSYTWTDCDL